MGRGEYNKVKSDENRTANVLICGSEAIEMPVFTQSLCNSTFASSRPKNRIRGGTDGSEPKVASSRPKSLKTAFNRRFFSWSPVKGRTQLGRNRFTRRQKLEIVNTYYTFPVKQLN